MYRYLDHIGGEVDCQVKFHHWRVLRPCQIGALRINVDVDCGRRPNQTPAKLTLPLLLSHHLLFWAFQIRPCFARVNLDFLGLSKKFILSLYILLHFRSLDKRWWPTGPLLTHCIWYLFCELQLPNILLRDRYHNGVKLIHQCP